jgi:large repetitive protein
VNAYAGQSTLTIRGYSAPPGISTVSIVANVSSSTVGSVLGNVAQIAPDINSGYQATQVVKSNTANTTIVGAPTVAITSPVNVSTTTTPTVSGTATPGASVTVTATSGQLCSTTANASGNWSCLVTVPAGAQSVTAIASNASGTSTPATASFTATNATLPLTASSPAVQTATVGVARTGNAASELAPQGGTAPYTYSNDTGNASCTAVAGATMLPPANLTVASGGSYTVSPPSTPGTYYYCIKVCDSGSPTPQCITKSYTLTVSPQSGVGTLDCSTAQIMGIVAGTPGNGTLKLTITVSTAGTMPVTVSGSGLAASPSPYVITATTTGLQTFYVPISYSGAAFGPTTITVGGAGVCSPDLSLVIPKTVSTSVLNLGPACTPATAATLIK